MKMTDSREITCIQCPQGCTLHAEKQSASSANGTSSANSASNANGANQVSNAYSSFCQCGDAVYKITGNKCPRGRAYAIKELTNPSRTLTTTVATIFDDCPLVSVRTDGDIPLRDVFRVMQELNNYRACKRLHPGEVLIEDLAGTGVALLATGDMTAPKTTNHPTT